MSRTLSVLIVENFVFNEGPKWDKFKRGAEKVKRGAKIASVVIPGIISGWGGYKMYDAPISHQSDIEDTHSVYKGKSDDFKAKWSMDTDNIKGDKSTSPETKENLIKELEKKHERDQSSNLDAYRNRRTQIDDKWDKQQKQGTRAMWGGLGLASASALAAYAAYDPKKSQAKKEEKFWRKEEKQAKKEEKQEKKSLKERLNMVKSGIFLNEESDDITALRNKISQGLIILPGLKGSVADKMEDAIRGWEDQINKLKNKIGEKYE